MVTVRVTESLGILQVGSKPALGCNIELGDQLEDIFNRIAYLFAEIEGDYRQQIPVPVITKMLETPEGELL